MRYKGILIWTFIGTVFFYFETKDREGQLSDLKASFVLASEKKQSLSCIENGVTLLISNFEISNDNYVVDLTRNVIFNPVNCSVFTN